jgi:hypothetical protein
MELNVLFRDIVSLEKENYENEARRFCKSYDKIYSLNRLIKDHADESLIVYCYKDEVLVAFIRFTLIEQQLSIMSLQIKEGNESHFFKLIKNTYKRLQSINFKWVEGKAYKDNTLAVSLHTKLGLCYSHDFGDRWGFITTKSKFMESLKKYVKR